MVFQWLWQHPRTIGIVIFVIFVVGQVVVKALQAKREQKRSMDESERVRGESLRTGRGGVAPAMMTAAPGSMRTAAAGSGSDDPQQRLRQLATQRQEQLRKMREEVVGAGRSQETSVLREGVLPQASARTPQVGPQSGTRELWPGGPVVMTRSGTPTGSSRTPARPQARPTARPDARNPGRTSAPPPARQIETGGRDGAQQREQQRRKQAARQKQKETDPAQARRESQQREHEQGENRRRAAALPMASQGVQEGQARPDGADEFVQLGAEDWSPRNIRRALVLYEVLGPPLSLRQQER